MGSIDPKMALLQLLISGPSYGVELQEKLAEKTNGQFSLSQGAVYQALKLMEADGYLTSYLDGDPIPEAGGRRRRYFKITADGRRAALEDRNAIASLFELSLPART